MVTTHVFIAVSLDGYIARQDGDIDWLLKRDDPTEDHGYAAFIADKDWIIMGRGSYEKVLTFDEWPYDRPVLVLSRQLCCGQLKLATALEFFQYRFSDSFGGNPPL